MNEKDIKRVEAKVNLLYRILLELKVDVIGHPYNQTYILKFMDELLPLFNISVKPEKIKDLPNQSDYDSKIQGIKNKIAKLEHNLDEGNFLLKNREKIDLDIKNLNDCKSICQDIIKTIRAIKRSNASIYNKRFFEALKKKLRVEEPEEKYRLDYELPRKSELELSLENIKNSQAKLSDLEGRLKAKEKSSIFLIEQNDNETSI